MHAATRLAWKTLIHASRWLFYSSLCVLADALDTVLSHLIPDIRCPAILLIQSSDADSLSDETVIKLIVRPRKLSPDSSAYQITSRTVAKISQDADEGATDASEANALDLVAKKTNIPVPRVHRVIKQEERYVILMDYIPGQTLAQLWPTYSIWKKSRVAFTLRRYIRQLQHLKATPATPPGPLSSQGPRICENPGIFSSMRSSLTPFASYAELAVFFNQRCKVALDHYKIPENDPSRKRRFDDSGPLVFGHQDLTPANIIVGEDGLFWIVDWSWAGYYPAWCEYATMLRQGDRKSDYNFWDCLVPFICGPYFKQEQWLSSIEVGLYYRE
ncbi:kinase-like protein [Pluteus cervinus]|uniref:Kinase-like protein n=1 Tax=Pluteus cervinus TaxID=181527 RepID=A0ACD3BCN2_9AGAR|nr:kinase-like protein [Pluteus cervinus]